MDNVWRKMTFQVSAIHSSAKLYISAIRERRPENYIKQKTPPIGENGGEKQYKDYEKNP